MTWEMEWQFQIVSGVLKKCTGTKPEVVIPSSASFIHKAAFDTCGHDVEQIYIPASVLGIAAGSFAVCRNLKQIIVAEDNPNYCAVDGVLYNKDMTVLVCYPSGKTGKSFKVPNTVAELLEYSFYGSFLEEVDISSVKHIDAAAFAQCKQLHTVYPLTVHSFDTPMVIGDNAFVGCIKIEEVYIPEGIFMIGESAFEHCHALEEVHFPEKVSVRAILPGTFSYCRKLRYIVIPEGILSIEACAFSHCLDLRVASLPDTLREIGPSAFCRCIMLSVKFPSKLKLIGNTAFYGCDSISSLEFPDNVTDIDARAFENCQSLREVKFGKGVKNIGEYAFQDCSHLTSVRLPIGLEEIGETAFDPQVDIL